MTIKAQLAVDSLEKGPLYTPSALDPPHATWDRYGNVKIHVHGQTYYLEPVDAVMLARQIRTCLEELHRL